MTDKTSPAYHGENDVEDGGELQTRGRHIESHQRVGHLPVNRGHEPGGSQSWEFKILSSYQVREPEISFVVSWLWWRWWWGPTTIIV